MTNLPGEGQVPQPQIDPTASRAELLARSGEISAELGELALRMTALTGQLSAITAQLETMPDEAPQSSERSNIELFSSIGAEAARPQSELETLSEKRDTFPDRIQEVFAASHSLFQGAMLTKASSADKKISIVPLSRTAPTRVPSYDREDPKDWNSFVTKHGRKLEWKEVDKGPNRENRYSFGVTYVRMADGSLEMTGYQYEHHNREGRRISGANITCSGGIVHTAEFTSTKGGYSQKYDFDEMTYKSGPYLTRTYNSETDHFESDGRGDTSSDDVINALTESMSLLPVSYE